MDVLSIVLIAIGLSMDSFAVSISNGLSIKELNQKEILTISISLSLFQALMLLIGWFAGIGIEQYIKEIDHWIAFVLLSIIGVKMIYEGIQKRNIIKQCEFKIFRLIVQSFATSIDALAVGISFAILNISIITPVMIVAVITFDFSIIGLLLGKYLGKRIGKYVEIFGGIVLIGIGLKVLIEHIYFS